MLDGTYETPAPLRPDLENGPLFGGITGADLDAEEVELLPGLRLRRTYAHIFAPFTLAFRRPEKPRTPHPGPWRTAGGGTAWDMTIELAIDAGEPPFTFDRLNTLWLVIALLRLRTALGVRMAVLSPLAFHEVASDPRELDFLTVETHPVQLQTGQVTRQQGTITEADTKWLRATLPVAAAALTTDHVRSAFMMFDDICWAVRPQAGILVAWGAIECALRPGRRDTGARLSRCIAALLTDERPEASRIQQQAAQLYDARGRIAHAGDRPGVSDFLDTVQMARRVFTALLTSSTMPKADELESRWRELART